MPPVFIQRRLESGVKVTAAVCGTNRRPRRACRSPQRPLRLQHRGASRLVIDGRKFAFPGHAWRRCRRDRTPSRNGTGRLSGVTRSGGRTVQTAAIFSSPAQEAPPRLRASCGASLFERPALTQPWPLCGFRSAGIYPPPKAAVGATYWPIGQHPPSPDAPAVRSEA